VALKKAEAAEGKGGKPAGQNPSRQEALKYIRPSHGWVSLGLAELWEFREVVFFLTWRDIKVRYKQTILGALWAILQPLLTMIIFSVIFGKLLNVSSDDIPYPLFAYSGLIIWTFFANGVSLASSSMVAEGNMIKKVYFPRMAIPIASIAAGLVDFLLAFIVLIGMMIYYGQAPSITILTLPLFLLLALFTALGVGMWFSALNVLFRDIRYVIPFLLQVWLFASPVAYSTSLIADKGFWNIIYGLNPMAGVVNGFRWALLGTPMEQPQIIIVSSVVSLVLLVSGAFFFKRVERNFADVV
jgi:lipopolysaccharide transport system permease protein